LEFIAPDTVEDVLKIVAMSNSHINLLALEVYNGVLAPVFKTVFIGGDGVVSQDLGESVCASGVHQVSQELHILWSELFFILHVNVDEISLANLSCDGVKLGVVVGDDRKNSGEFVVNKVVVILAIVEGI